MTLFVSLFILLGAQNDLACKWGEKSSLPPQASCGTPTRIRLPLPAGSRRFEFRRTDNPSLTSYFHRRRDGRGPVKRFSNLINLLRVDLFLCPKDFEKPRTLLFKQIKGGRVKRFQCRLSSPGVHSQAPVMSTTPSAAGKSMASPMRTPPSPAPRKRGVAPQSPGDSVVQEIIPPPKFRAAQRDPYARLIGTVAVIFTGLFMLLFSLALFLLRSKVARLERSLSQRPEKSDTPT